MAGEAEEPKTITPFKLMNAGEDTLGPDDEVLFADFRPRVVPSDTPDEVEDADPKVESAPELAPYSESTQTPEPQTSEKSVPTPAEEGAGQSSPQGNGKQNSSSGLKSG